jgi:REP element-mobilizing transposase RayT
MAPDVVEQAFLPARKQLSLEKQTSVLAGQTFLSAHMSSPPSESDLEITRRRLPHWTLEGSVYFVTFRIAGERQLNDQDREIVLQHIQSGCGRFYLLFATVVMPDHVHVILRPHNGVELARVTKGIKGVSAKLLNVASDAWGSVWQDESWDRIVRDEKELDEKLRYMLNNPVKRGLVSDPWTYDAWYYNPDAK